MKLMLRVLLVASCLDAVGLCSAQSQIAANYRFCPSATKHQSYVQVAGSLHGQDTLFATFTFYQFLFSSNIVTKPFTTNGGLTWQHSCPDTIIEVRSDRAARPAIGLDGRFLMGYTTTFGYTSPAMLAVRSTDLGYSWMTSANLTTSPDATALDITEDNAMSSPTAGHAYATWTHYTSGSTPATIRLRRTTDRGVTWLATQQLSSFGSSTFSNGSNVRTGPDGEVYVCWIEQSVSSPYASRSVGLARSTDGGANWTATNNAYACNGIGGTLTSKGNISLYDYPKMAVDRSGSARYGRIYIVTPEKNLSPAGADPDIVLRYSTNGGVSWSSGVRVNQDPLSNGKTQFSPSIAVDGSGRLFVLYYDDRNTSTDSCEVYLSCSTDGGATWRDLPASDHRYKPARISNSTYEGTSIAATGNHVIACWTDNSTGTYQAWYARVAISAIMSAREMLAMGGFLLEQNYPNPFNPTTEIRYHLPALSVQSGQAGMSEVRHVSLKVYDVLGREVATLVNDAKSAGTYSVQWNAEGFSSGVYFYQLRSGTFSATKRMLIMK
ncbi:MAG: exo-alpha-sialidase [Ignavibacteriae bacterium]|nr:exo-alpha-sialidase [Ignavibacteriota bacterium]